MSRIGMGWRLAKDSWAVLRADRSLAVFPALSIASAAVAFVLIPSVGVGVAEAAGPGWLALPFLLAGLYAASFCVVYFNVALAGAARLSMDGRDTKLSDGLAVARERRGLIAKWALLQLTVGILVSALQDLFGEGSGRMLGAVVSGLALGAWTVASFFVIPILALEGLGPGDSLRRSAKLVRERWGEGLTGTAGIGFAVFVVALVPLLGLFGLAYALTPVSTALGVIVYVFAALAVVATLALGSALGVIFRVELFRYATEGQVPKGFAKADLDAAFRPGRRRGLAAGSRLGPR